MVDHLLVIGFGGPTRPEDVTPFLDEVTRGLPIPPARLAEVARHYQMTGGASPYNEYTSRLVEKLKTRLREDGVSLPVFIGMRNWHPFLKETMRTIKAQRLKHGVGIILAPHRCEASFGKYLHNVEDAKRHASAGEVTYESLRPWHDHPLFIQAQADEVRKALERISPMERDAVHLVFSAHSIPVEMARRSRYEEEYRTSCELVANALHHAAWSLAYQSRSGHPREPWLEPDVRSVFRQLQERGVRRVLLIPIGFLLDHTEVLYDLDIDAKEHAQRVGVEYLRASTVMDHPAFVEMFSQLIRDQLAVAGGVPQSTHAGGVPQSTVYPVGGTREERLRNGTREGRLRKGTHTLLIAGCGYVGLALSHALSRQGWTVWGVRRNPQARRRLEEAGARPLIADLTDPAALVGLPPVEYVVSAQAPGRRGRDPSTRRQEAYRATYLEGARNLVHALAAHPPTMWLGISSTSVYGDTNGEWVDESTPPNPNSDEGAILLEMEAVILQAPFPSVVLRLAGIYGPGRETRHVLRDGRASLSDAGYLNQIHVEDVVGLIHFLLEHGTSKEIYLGADDEPVVKSAFYAWLADRTGIRLPVSGPVARSRFSGSKRCSNRKIRALGYALKYPSYREGVASAEGGGHR